MKPESSPILEKYQVPEEQEIPEWIVNEAHLINEALDKGTVTKTEAQEALVENKELLEVMRGLVDIKYFVEYPPENVGERDRGEMLLELFSSPLPGEEEADKSLADYLAENGQGISLAMSTLDDSTAEAVRYLNQKGVPVVGWVVVDDIEGYWTNPTNIAETADKTEEIKEWAQEHDLDIVALGYDLEKPIEYISSLAQFNIGKSINTIRDFRRKKAEAAKLGDPEEQLQDILNSVKEAGLETEIYSFPRGLKGFMAGIDVRDVDRYVEMVYASFFPAAIQERGLPVPYMLSEDAIPALGIVSGKDDETPGRDLTPGNLPRHLTKEDLTGDINRLLDQKLNLDDREFSLRNLYLFALNDARVAVMLESAMNKTFERQEEKWE